MQRERDGERLSIPSDIASLALKPNRVLKQIVSVLIKMFYFFSISKTMPFPGQ